MEISVYLYSVVTKLWISGLYIVSHAPATYSELTAFIATEFVSLPQQLQKFGRFVLDNSDVLALETVTTVAERAGVQPSAIVRFAKAMGHDGFSDLQQICRNQLMKDTSSYRERVKTLMDDGREGPAAVLDAFTAAGIETLEKLRLNTKPDDLKRAVEILRSADDIHLFAQGRSYAVAQYLYYALSRLEVRCFLTDGTGGMLDQQIGKIGPSDAVIAISFAPYTLAVGTIVAALAERGVDVISITDSPVSPLAAPSSVNFEISESIDQAFRTLVAPICLAQSLVVSLGQTLSENSTEPSTLAG